MKDISETMGWIMAIFGIPGGIYLLWQRSYFWGIWLIVGGAIWIWHLKDKR